MRWGLIFGFYVSTKWLSYRNILFLPTAEICHHGNLLDLEGRGASGKSVAATSEIITQIGLLLVHSYKVLAHRSEGGHMDLNSCLLSLKETAFGAISSLIQLAPSFPACSSKPAWLSRSCWTALCSGIFTSPTVAGKQKS